MEVIIFILTCAVAYAIWQNWKLRKGYMKFARETEQEILGLKNDFVDFIGKLHIVTNKKYDYLKIPLETMCDDIFDMINIDHHRLAGQSDINNYYEENIKLQIMHLTGLVKYLGLKFNYRDSTRKEIVYSKPKPKTKKGKK